MKLTKRILLVLTAILLCAAALSCSASGDKKWQSSASAYDVLERMITAANEYEARDDAEYLEDGLIYRGDSTADGEFLTDGQKAYYYGTIAGDPDFSGVLDYALWTAVDSVSTEMGVFVTSDDKAAETVEAFVNERIATLTANAKDYKAEEQAKAENALVAVKGKYVIYIVTNINDELEAMAEAAITDKAPTASASAE